MRRTRRKNEKKNFFFKKVAVSNKAHAPASRRAKPASTLERSCTVPVCFAAAMSTPEKNKVRARAERARCCRVSNCRGRRKRGSPPLGGQRCRCLRETATAIPPRPPPAPVGHCHGAAAAAGEQPVRRLRRQGPALGERQPRHLHLHPVCHQQVHHGGMRARALPVSLLYTPPLCAAVPLFFARSPPTCAQLQRHPPRAGHAHLIRALRQPRRVDAREARQGDDPLGQQDGERVLGGDGAGGLLHPDGE